MFAFGYQRIYLHIFKIVFHFYNFYRLLSIKMDKSTNIIITLTSSSPPSSTASENAARLMFGMSVYTVLSFLFSAIGILPNFSVVYITWKQKNRSTFSYLLAFTCFFDMCAEVSTILPMILQLGQWQITLFTCFVTQWYDVFALNMVYQMLFITALDRLAALLFPIWYMNATKKRPLNLLIGPLVLALIHIGFYLGEMLFYVLQNSEMPVFCQTLDYSHGFTYLGACIIVLSTIGLYVFIWILIKAGRSISERRIFKSLFVISFVHFLFWLIPVTVPSYILPMFTLDSVTSIILARVFGIGIRVSGILNVPILFFNSKDYREMLVKQFGFYAKLASLFKFTQTTITIQHQSAPFVISTIHAANLQKLRNAQIGPMRNI